jgi:calcineurin-like phosphoesterase family protein
VIFFTSDTHFWHVGVKTHRPWVTDVEQMNNTLIEAWNAKVGPFDTVYHLGDLSFAGLEKTVAVVGQLIGSIKLVPGNHDDPALIRKLQEMGLIEVMPPLLYIKPEGRKIALCHFPLVSWRSMHFGSWMLHGHSHGNLDNKDVGKRLDVGVDALGAQFGAAPISMDDIALEMAKRPFVQVDHHKERINEEAKAAV